MCRNIKKFLRKISGMCEESYQLLRGTLMLSCVMVFCAFIILIDCGEFTIHTWKLYRTARELTMNPAGLLLIATIGSALLEERAGTS